MSALDMDVLLLREYTSEKHLGEMPIGRARRERLERVLDALAARDAELATARASLATACENLRLENLRAEDYRRKHEAASAPLAARDAELAQARAEVERLREALYFATEALDAIDVALCGGSRERYTIEGVRKTTSATLKALATLAATGEAQKTSEASGAVPAAIAGKDAQPSTPAGGSEGAGTSHAAADGASEGSAFPNCPDCGEEIDPVFGRCRDPSHKPPPEPDDYERAALEWYLAHHDRWADSDNVKALVALLRTREAAAKRQGVREGWEGAGKALRGSDGSSDLADWLDARKLEVE